MNRSRVTWSCIALLAAAAALARLPQLLSPNLLAEGDECLVGLMGLHIARGHDFPLFFYGQKYGLAIVEAPAAALSFTMFGAGPATLKAAILAVWIAGAVFYFRAFSRVVGTARSFWITLLLVLMPAWAATSMKAWSGYVTAFCASGAVIDVITGNRHERSARWIAAGIATTVVYFAHPLWLPGLVPIVLYHLVVSRRMSSWIAYASATWLPIAVMTAVKKYWLVDIVEVWFGPPLGNPHLLASIPRVVRQIYVSLTGSFYFAQTVVPGRVTAATAYFWFALLCVLLVLQGYRFVTRRRLTWSHLLTASIGLTLLSNWALLEERDARYIMAMHAPLVFLAGTRSWSGRLRSTAANRSSPGGKGRAIVIRRTSPRSIAPCRPAGRSPLSGTPVTPTISRGWSPIPKRSSISTASTSCTSRPTGNCSPGPDSGSFGDTRRRASRILRNGKVRRRRGRSRHTAGVRPRPCSPTGVSSIWAQTRAEMHVR